MQGFILFTSVFHLCLSYTVDPRGHNEQANYPDFGRIVDSNSPQIRRRPLLSDSSAPSNMEFLIVPTWPNSTLRFGQIAAVTVDKQNRVLVFHRGSHVWNGDSFNVANEYRRKEDGPIFEDPVLALHPTSGNVLKSWGKNLFFMPHGLSTDHEDNLWVTDVALHQVLKFPPLNTLGKNSTPLLSLGERFVPGSDNLHFCKPSAVAVLPNGDFFVSDGYCNYRVNKYDSSGQLLLTWGRSTFSGIFNPGRSNPTPYQFNIPHALTLAEDRGLLCVADRENGRVLCFHSSNGTFAYEISSQILGTRVFSVTYSPTNGGLFYIVNGPDQFTPVKGFGVDANNLKVLSVFPSGSTNLSNPHDIAVSSDGGSVYVAQLDPQRVLKFVLKGAVSVPQPYIPTTDSSSQSHIKIPETPTPSKSVASNNTGVLPSDLNLMANSAFAKAISIPLWAMASLAVILVCVVGTGIGCCVRARRRAYAATPSEGFKLGQLLDARDRRGFEQISTEESDDDRMDGDQPA